MMRLAFGDSLTLERILSLLLHSSVRLLSAIGTIQFEPSWRFFRGIVVRGSPHHAEA